MAVKKERSIVLGKNAKGAIYLCDEARKANLAVFGIKNTGKAYTLIPYLLEQDLVDKNMGITIVVDTPNLAWYLYSLARLKDRKVQLIKPSVNLDVLNSVLYKDEWDYNEINKIIDYSKAIKEKKVVIIDMEQEKFGDEAIRATSMLLLQLQADMVNERKENIKHSVYIDNAGDFLPYIKNLLKYGDYHNFYTTLFFKSRNHLEDKLLLNEYVRNYILLQGITWEDAKYFGERFGIDSPYNTAINLMDRSYGEFAYEILSGRGELKRVVSFGQLEELDPDLHKNILEKSEQWKKRNKTIINEDQHLQLETEKEALKKDEVEGYYEKMENEIIKETVENVPKQETKQKELVPEIDNKTEIKEKIQEVEEIATEEIEPEIEPIEVDLEDEIEPEFDPEEFSYEEPSEEFVPTEPEEIEVDLEEEPKEPQLNKKRKSVPFKEKERDLSAIENIEITLDEPIEERVPQIIDLKDTEDINDETYLIKPNTKKVLPYQKIINKKVKKSLDVLKW